MNHDPDDNSKNPVEEPVKNALEENVVKNALRSRLRAALAHPRDAGASALEWAIIAAVVVVAASLIGGAVYKIVADKSQALEACANVAVGAACAGGSGAS